MRLIIAGSRTIDSEHAYQTLCGFLEAFTLAYGIPDVVLSGGSQGVDKLGERWAKEHGIEPDVHDADWNRYGNDAGPIRNAAMAEDATHLFALWDGKSTGTSDMIAKAQAAGLFVVTMRYAPDQTGLFEATV